MITESTLTPRQMEIIRMVSSFIERHGFPPSTREVQIHFGFSSQTAVISHFRALKRKGALDWSPGRGRTLSLGSVKHLPSPSPLYTYFLFDEVSGKVKIGRSSNIQDRIYRLETIAPLKLSVLAMVPSSHLTEKEAHELFSKDRIRGEWFEHSDEMKAWLSQLQKKGGKAR